MPNGRSPIGGSFDQDPFGGLPPNLPIGLYKWSAPDPRIFMPLWYPPVTILSKLTNKFPYQKLQYPRYVKDTDHDAHIKFFKKASKANGETMELISSTCLVSLYKTIFKSGVKILYKIIPIPPSRSWSRDFVNIYKYEE